ncbi:MAG: hypothetical protein ACLU9S_05810 [Oscillospiraceae bacterium]
MWLGGSVLGFSKLLPPAPAAARGESVADTAKTGWSAPTADIIAMRHPKEGAPLV